jgi:hypothetical protein
MGDRVQQLGHLAPANLPDGCVLPGRQQVEIDPALILAPRFLLRFRMLLQELIRELREQDDRWRGRRVGVLRIGVDAVAQEDLGPFDLRTRLIDGETPPITLTTGD